MINTQDYIDYFKNLAILHKKIKHNLGGEKRFTAISMEDVINNINHNLVFHPENGAADYALMLLEEISGQFRGRDVRNMNDEPDGAFVILKHCPNEDFDRERAIYNECKGIAVSLLGTMTNDYETNANNIMKYLEPEKGVRYMKVGPVFEHCFGIRVEFAFSKSILLKHVPGDYDMA
jgi:hypothetical protein